GNPMLVNQSRVVIQSQPQITPRSFVALDQEGRVILGLANWVGLLDLANYLARKDGLNCVNALNLEGGSEGLFIKMDGFEREYRGTRAGVPNAVAVFQKQGITPIKSVLKPKVLP
ncbi:MAG: phosphodiester glycosidase family protein, partial [bacterium]